MCIFKYFIVLGIIVGFLKIFLGMFNIIISSIL